MGSYYSQLELRLQRNYDTRVPWTNVISASVGTKFSLAVSRNATLNLSQLGWFLNSLRAS